LSGRDEKLPVGSEAGSVPTGRRYGNDVIEQNRQLSSKELRQHNLVNQAL
jgi:hypothetical protein